MQYIFRGFTAAISALAVTAAITGCSNYDDTDKKMFSDYGTAYRHEGNETTASYYIVRDDGAEMYITSNLWPEVEPADGERVKFNYEMINTIESPQWASWRDRHEITLYFISNVRTEQPIMESFIMEKEQHRRDSIGDDPLAEITRMFFSGGYVNVEYRVYARIVETEEALREKSYMMNLVVDDINMNDDMITVYVRYNAKGALPQNASDANFVKKESEVSFYAGELMPEDKNSIKIKFVWTELQRGKRTETKIFYRDQSSYMQIVGTMENSALTENSGS